MILLDGKKLSERIIAQIEEEIGYLKEKSGAVPGLAVIKVGDDPASAAYVAGKKKAAQKCGISSTVYQFPASISRQELLQEINRLNQQEETDAILLQLPLPAHLDSFEFMAAISWQKDADCFHPENFGRIIYQKAEIFPCTPAGVIKLLEHYEIKLRSRRVAIVGRSVIVGKPLALMMINADATVTVCHSKTADLKEILHQSDIVVAALGKPAFLKAEMFRQDAVLVDVGINQISTESDFQQLADPSRKDEFLRKGYLLVGDIHYQAYEKSSYYTPVPGGVGPLTVAMLLYNTLQLFKRRRSL